MTQRMEELIHYHDNIDDIQNGVFLKNKKYWYLYYGSIQYGYVSDNKYHGTHDGSCKNRITYYGIAQMRSFKQYREISIRDISCSKTDILKKYAMYLKSIGTGQRQLSKLAKTFPELVI